MTKQLIAWDLGATKCFAGVVEYDEKTNDLVCKKTHTLKLVETDSLENLVEQLEAHLDFKMSDADAVCIGAAGQYDGEFLKLENAYPYPMHFARVARNKHWPAYAVIHDYAPIVCATFTSYMENQDNIKRLNSYEMEHEGRRVAFGIGTGLGMKDGVLFANGDFWLGRNEVGHIGITTPPMADAYRLERHREIMKFLREKEPKEGNQVTFEKLLSGSGTVRLHQFFYSNSHDITPEEVGAQMREGNITEMLDTLAWYAGLFVGTIQLIFMPEGGIWITGGVTMKNLHLFDRPDFNAGINASPAYKTQREAYPLGLLCNDEHALIGCGYYATKRLLKNSA